MRENEERYVAALKEGSREAFTMLYNLYADRLYSFALVQTKSKQMAEDVVQDTFLKLWNNRTNLNCYGNVQALVFTMARNLIIDASVGRWPTSTSMPISSYTKRCQARLRPKKAFISTKQRNIWNKQRLS